MIFQKASLGLAARNEGNGWLARVSRLPDRFEQLKCLFAGLQVEVFPQESGTLGELANGVGTPTEGPQGVHQVTVEVFTKIVQFKCSPQGAYAGVPPVVAAPEESQALEREKARLPQLFPGVPAPLSVWLILK